MGGTIPQAVGPKQKSRKLAESKHARTHMLILSALACGYNVSLFHLGFPTIMDCSLDYKLNKSLCPKLAALC